MSIKCPIIAPDPTYKTFCICCAFLLLRRSSNSLPKRSSETCKVGAEAAEAGCCTKVLHHIGSKKQSVSHNYKELAVHEVVQDLVNYVVYEVKLFFESVHPNFVSILSRKAKF